MMLRLGYDIQLEIPSPVAMVALPNARHNCPRFGRVLIATGRHASDVAITTSFGMANLTNFTVVSEELTQENARYA
jgi:hypothetical protein